MVEALRESNRDQAVDRFIQNIRETDFNSPTQVVALEKALREVEPHLGARGFPASIINWNVPELFEGKIINWKGLQTQKNAVKYSGADAGDDVPIFSGIYETQAEVIMAMTVGNLRYDTPGMNDKMPGIIRQLNDQTHARQFMGWWKQQSVLGTSVAGALSQEDIAAAAERQLNELPDTGNATTPQEKPAPGAEEIEQKEVVPAFAQMGAGTDEQTSPKQVPPAPVAQEIMTEPVDVVVQEVAEPAPVDTGQYRDAMRELGDKVLKLNDQDRQSGQRVRNDVAATRAIIGLAAQFLTDEEMAALKSAQPQLDTQSLFQLPEHLFLKTETREQVGGKALGQIYNRHVDSALSGDNDVQRDELVAALKDVVGGLNHELYVAAGDEGRYDPKVPQAIRANLERLERS